MRCRPAARGPTLFASRELAARRVEQAADVLAERVGDEGDLRRREVAAGAESVVGRAHPVFPGRLTGNSQYFLEKWCRKTPNALYGRNCWGGERGIFMQAC